MTRHDVPTIEYASRPGDAAMLPRRLRLAVAWAAIVYGLAAGLGAGYWFAISREWLPIPLWNWGEFTLLQNLLEWSNAGGCGLIAAAGLLLLLRADAGILLLRIGATLALLAICGEQLRNMIARDPSQYQLRAMGLLSALMTAVLPALLLVLTFGPTGRTLREK